MSSVDLVVVGHATRDVVADDPRGWRLGGAASFVSLAVARLGLRVAVLIGLDPLAAGALELELLVEAGVTIERVPLAHGPVFENIETPHGRHQNCLDAGPPLPVERLPAAWMSTRAMALVPILGEVGGAAWASCAPPGAFLAVGWQGMLREPLPGGATRRLSPAADPTIARADLVVASGEDLRREDGTHFDAGELGPFFPRPGQALVISEGLRGGSLYRRRGGGWSSVRYEAVGAREHVDPTGAGDVFLAGLVAATLDEGLVRGLPDGDDARLRVAATAAALSVEGPGLHGVPDRRALRRRLGFPDARGA